MDKTTLFDLFEAICRNDAKAVMGYCEGKVFKGTLSPSPFALALQIQPINSDILERLLAAGILPTAQDQKIYNALPELSQPILPKSFHQKPSLLHWFQRSSLSSDQLGKLWQIACERNEVQLSEYLLKHYSFSQNQFQEGVKIAKERSHQEVLVSLVKQALFTRREEQELLFDAVKKSHMQLINALIQQWELEQHSSLGKLKHTMAQVVTHLRDDPPSHSLKEALFLAMREKKIEVVELLLGYPQYLFDDQDHKCLWEALLKNLSDPLTAEHNQLVQYCLSHPLINPGLNNIGISTAAAYGHIGLVKLLLNDKRANVAAETNAAISYASANGHVEIVKLLLNDPRVHPAAETNHAIRKASANGHVEVVKLLLKDDRVNPAACGNYAIQKATANGHVEVVKLLLKDDRVNPTAWDNYAIRKASENGHWKVVKILAQDSRVINILNTNNTMAVELSTKQRNPHLLRIILENQHYKLTDLSDVSLNYAIENKDTASMKVLLNFASKECLQAVYQKVPALAQEMPYFHAFLSSFPKQELKALKKEALMAINTNHILKAGELLHYSGNAEKFKEVCTDMMEREGAQLLKAQLKQAAKAFYPLLAAGKAKVIHQREEGKYNEALLHLLAFYLAPFLPTVLAEKFFKVLNDQILHAPKEYIQRSVDLMTKEYAGKAVDILVSKLDYSQLPEKSWARQIKQESTNSRANVL